MNSLTDASGDGTAGGAVTAPAVPKPKRMNKKTREALAAAEQVGYEKGLNAAAPFNRTMRYIEEGVLLVVGFLLGAWLL
jgi:hypothetical protein